MTDANQEVASTPVAPTEMQPWVRLPEDPGHVAPEDDPETIAVTPTTRATNPAKAPVVQTDLILDIDEPEPPQAPASSPASVEAQGPGPVAPELADRVQNLIDEGVIGVVSETETKAAPPAVEPLELEIDVNIPKPSSAKDEPTSPPVVAMPGGGLPFRGSRKRTGAPPSVNLKAFFFGDTGTGKTLTGLGLPDVLADDLEGGMELYEDDFEFETIEQDAFGGRKANDWDRLNGIVDFLIAHPDVAKNYRTLLIDPFTVAWEACCDRWGQRFLAKQQKSAGHKGDFYNLQPADWRHLKGDLKKFFRKLGRLNMHIAATAREKPKYAQGTGEMMKVIGETFDAEKNLPYYFDLVVKFRKHPTAPEVFEALVMKSRNFWLPRASYVYRGATGFADLIRRRLEGEMDPQPRGEHKVGSLEDRASKPTAPDNAVGSVGFDGELVMEMD